MNNLRELSKREWTVECETERNIELSALVRIADAIETVAVDRIKLERELAYFKRLYEDRDRRISHLLRRLAALKGQNTKLRKRIAEIEEDREQNL